MMVFASLFQVRAQVDETRELPQEDPDPSPVPVAHLLSATKALFPTAKTTTTGELDLPELRRNSKTPSGQTFLDHSHGLLSAGRELAQGFVET